MKKAFCLLLVLLSLLLVTGCEGSANDTNGSNGTDIPEEVSGPDITVPLPEGALRIRVTDAGDNSFQIDYWVPLPLEDVIDFYLNEFASWQNMYHFEGAYADGEYTFHWEGDIIDDTGIFVIEIDRYRKNEVIFDDQTRLIIQGDGYWYK